MLFVARMTELALGNRGFVETSILWAIVRRSVVNWGKRATSALVRERRVAPDNLQAGRLIRRRV